MKFNQQVEEIINYFKKGETDQQQIGIEVEHFVIDQTTLETITYQEPHGIEYLLSQLSKTENWEPTWEGNHLIGLKSDSAIITLEPGGQLEISTIPCSNLVHLKQIYDLFLQDIIPILEQENYYLITLGYQLKSEMQEIPFNPKKRYQIMAQYLQEKGKYAHHMMKGTASLQIALDYKSETDFMKKFCVASFLAPVVASLFDNAPIFEGEVYQQQALRRLIWQNTDPSRTGVVADCLANDFNYQTYAEYILTKQPILLETNGEYISTGDKKAWQLFKNKQLGEEEIEHLLTMVFPDVRAKQFIEIRMIDSLPPRLMMAAIAFWKGLFYNQFSLDQAYQFSNQFAPEEVVKAQEKVIYQGLAAQIGDKDVLKVAHKMTKWAKQGLTEEEREYLIPLEKLLTTEQTPAEKLKCRLEQGSRWEAIKNCILNYY